LRESRSRIEIDTDYLAVDFEASAETVDLGEFGADREYYIGIFKVLPGFSAHGAGAQRKRV